jgi:membrane protein
MEISVYGAYASYFIILSVFPTLVLLLGLLRYTNLRPDDLMDFLGGYLPVALQPQAWELIAGTYANTSGTVLSLSALTALWSAGKGIHGLMKGLNRIYGIREERSWLKTRSMCMVYMVLFILVLLLTLVLHVFGNTIVELLRYQGGPFVWLWTDLLDLRFFLLVAVQSLLFCVMFMYLPGRNNGFRESIPGALFSSVGWMAVSYLFSMYVEHFSGYTSIFGPVYAVALIMLWLYVCVCTVFAGAVLNRLLQREKK